jgi:hypothetical protein
MSGTLNLLGLAYSQAETHHEVLPCTVVGSCSTTINEQDMSRTLHLLGLAYSHWLKHTMRCCYVLL